MAADRLPAVREMILAENEEERAAALEKILPMQQADFEGIFTAMKGLPVTVRLLDPPLHEFLPNIVEQSLLGAGARTHRWRRRDLAKERDDARPGQEAARAEPDARHPWLPSGDAVPVDPRDADPRHHPRGPGRAGARGRDRRRRDHDPAGRARDRDRDPARYRRPKAVGDELEAAGKQLDYTIGTMIELPRAALIADKIAEHADFFSFGTNDLTQTTFGISRDDAENGFLGAYVADGVLPRNPFETIDIDGVGQLVQIGVEKGRTTKPEAEDRCLRRARWRSGFDRVLPDRRARTTCPARRSGCRSPASRLPRPPWSRSELILV